MWAKVATAVLLVGELLLRWLQSRDKEAGKAELKQEIDEENKERIDAANDIRAGELSDELLLKPRDRKLKLRIVQAGIRDRFDRSEDDPEGGSGTN